MTKSCLVDRVSILLMVSTLPGSGFTLSGVYMLPKKVYDLDLAMHLSKCTPQLPVFSSWQLHIDDGHVCCHCQIAGCHQLCPQLLYSDIFSCVKLTFHISWFVICCLTKSVCWKCLNPCKYLVVPWFHVYCGPLNIPGWCKLWSCFLCQDIHLWHLPIWCTPFLGRVHYSWILVYLG